MQSEYGEGPATSGRDTSASLSGDEFRRMQEQLIELRNSNYELMEKNKHLQSQASANTPKANETFNFASKLIRRKLDKQPSEEKCEHELKALRTKLTIQEEEFRLQQSTLLAELNKVISQNKSLEEQLKSSQEVGSSDGGAKEDESADPSCHLKTNVELEREIAWLKGVLAEKDSLVEDIEILNKDMLRAKNAESERANNAEKRIFALEKQLEEKQKSYDNLEETMQIKEEETVLLKSRLEGFCRKSDAHLCDKASQSDFFCGVDASTSCEAIADEQKALESQKTQTDPEFMEKYCSLQCSIVELEKKYEKVQEARSVCDQRIKDLTSANAKLEKETKDLGKQLNQLQEGISQRDNIIAIAEKTAEQMQKDRDEWEKQKQSHAEEIQSLESRTKDLESTWETDYATLQQDYKELETKLENEVKQGKERLKTKDQEIHVALKKQSSMVRELRRQVQQEKKRAEQAERQLEEALGSGRHYRITGSPLVSSDHSRNDGKTGAEGSSSVCSWAFVAESDRRSTHTFDGEESSCSASILESDNVELISRLAQLQKKHSETIDRLNMLEEENTLLRKEVAEKSEVIAEWIRTKPCGDSNAAPSPSKSPSLRIRRMFDIVRIDDSAADIRDMNRRLQRMLEETLSKNLNLQKDIQRLLENGKTDAPK